MAKQTTKRCHWVSQSYLRAFAADPDARQKIWRLSKTKGEAELKPIGKVAIKFHLYSPKRTDGSRDDSLEKKLSELENWLGSQVWTDVCTDFPDLGWEPVRKLVALVVATTYLRNPLQFETTKAIHRQLVDFYSSGPGLPTAIEHKGKVRPIDVSSWPVYRDADEEDLKRHWNAEVAKARWIAEILLKMRWAIMFSEEPVFVTSDNPVVILHPSLKFRGLNNRQTMVMFPLSPMRMLLLDHRYSEPDARYYPLKCDPASMNGLIWREANEHMFSSRHPDIVCAEMLADAKRMGFA